MFLKKSSSKSTVKNIVTVNAYTNKSCIFKDEQFKSLKKLSYSTSNFITSYLANKDIITMTAKLSRSIPDEDIADILDIKAYEELGLDQASEYVIEWMEFPAEAEEREFHIFVVQPEVLQELYLSVKENTKYIDLIIPVPLLYKTLYRREILQNSGVHCYIYFTMRDAFVTLYNNGEYFYSKSIDFSLEHIYERYCEIVGEKVDENVFFTVLESEGLKTINSDYQQAFMKIFGEIFIAINDIVIYAKRAFELDSVNQVFIGSVKGTIIGLDEYSQNYLGLQSSDFDFNYNINSDKSHTDSLQTLMLLNTLDYFEDKASIINLTMFPRPPSFTNRASGQFILTASTAIFLGLAYPLVYLIGSYINDAKIYTLNTENNELVAETNKYKKILSDKKRKIAALEKELSLLSDSYHAKTKTLMSIYDKKVHYRLKSGTFYTIAEVLSKFGVHIDMLYSEDDKLWLSLVSSDDRKFTELIKYISETHFDEINQIDIGLIKKDKQNNDYRGLLKVELK